MVKVLPVPALASIKRVSDKGKSIADNLLITGITALLLLTESAQKQVHINALPIL